MKCLLSDRNLMVNDQCHIHFILLISSQIFKSYNTIFKKQNQLHKNKITYICVTNSLFFFKLQLLFEQYNTIFYSDQKIVYCFRVNLNCSLKTYMFAPCTKIAK